MLDKMDTVIVNDFLFSNETIYNAFFLQETFNKNKPESKNGIKNFSSESNTYEIKSVRAD